MGPLSARSGDWQVPVLTSCALSGDGVVGLLEAIDGHRAALDACGAMAARRADINARRLFLAGEELLRDAMSRPLKGQVGELIALLDARVLGPHAAAKRLLADIRSGGDA
jgi:LAO/AO transport system kinase